MGHYFEFKLPEKPVTEIRVHGVGGTPPDEMLDDPHPQQVTGDDLAGFFRKTSTDPERDVEAYSWGGLTSRSKARSLWLLLLPFSLVNVGGWMVESDTSKDRGQRQPHAEIQERTVRVVGALTTLALVAWLAALFVDIVGFQCAMAPACREGHWWLEWLGDKAVFAQHPGLLVAVTLVVPLVVFAGIDVLAKRVRTNYDEYSTADPDRPAPAEAGDMANLTNRSFWNRPTLVRDLAWLHRACVLLALAAAFAYTLGTFEVGSERDSLTDAAWVLGAASALAALGTAALRLRRREHDEPRRAWLPALLTTAGGLSLVALTVYAWRTTSSFQLGATPALALPADAPALIAFRRLPFIVLAGQVGLLLVGVVAPQVYWWVRETYGKRARKRVSPEGFRDRLARAWAILLLGLALVMLVRPTPVLLGAVVVAGTLAIVRRATLDRVPASRLLPRWWKGWALAAVAIAPAVWCWASGNRTPALVTLAAVAVATAVRATQETWRADVFRWGGIAVAPLFGVFLLAGAFTGVAIRLRDFLDKDEGSGISIVLPSAYTWFAVAFASALALTAFAAAVVHRRSARLASELGLEDLPEADFRHRRAPRPPRELPENKLAPARAAIRKSIALVRTARAGDVLMTALCALTILGMAIGVRIALTTESDEEGWNRLFGGDNYPFLIEWGWLRTASSWLLAGLPLVLVLAFRRGMRDEAMRRRIGTVWDIVTFWPRRFHPFAPPSYAERAVPELQQRIAEARAARDGTGSVALLGHSQGSIVSLAALASLGPQRLSRVALVTYGSPLGTLYRRFFPSYFTTELFDKVGADLKAASKLRPVWRNFFRWTDPIGGPVFATELNDPPHGRPPAPPADDSREDVHLHDPWWWWDVLGQPSPHPLGHSTYLADPDMSEWTEGLWKQG